jgi:hypothetical protein
MSGYSEDWLGWDLSCMSGYNEDWLGWDHSCMSGYSEDWLYWEWLPSGMAVLGMEIVGRYLNIWETVYWEVTEYWKETDYREETDYEEETDYREETECHNMSERQKTSRTGCVLGEVTYWLSNALLP